LLTLQKAHHELADDRVEGAVPERQALRAIAAGLVSQEEAVRVLNGTVPSGY